MTRKSAERVGNRSWCGYGITAAYYNEEAATVIFTNLNTRRNIPAKNDASRRTLLDIHVWISKPDVSRRADVEAEI